MDNSTITAVNRRGDHGHRTDVSRFLNPPVNDKRSTNGHESIQQKVAERIEEYRTGIVSGLKSSAVYRAAGQWA